MTNYARARFVGFQLFLAGLLIAVAACAGAGGPRFVDNEECSDISRDQLTRTSVKLHFDTGYVVEADAEVARTTEQHRQGLMCREEVNPATGMLFLFDSPRIGQFWMFNTYVDLDIIYIASDGSIADIKRMTSCTRNGQSRDDWAARCDRESTSYAPSRAYSATLELPANWLESETIPGTSLRTVSWD